MKHKNRFNHLFASISAAVFLGAATIASAKGPGGALGIPCDGANCTLEDVFTLINKLIEFAITRLFFPIFIVAILYVGYTYLTAGGDPKKVASVKKMAWHILLGILLVLGAWLIVKTTLDVIGADEAAVFLQEK